MKTSDKILEMITKQGSVTAKQLYETLPINQSAVFKQLSNLIDQNKIIKTGKVPKVYYSLSSNIDMSSKTDLKIEDKAKKAIENNFMYISFNGQRLDGLRGFVAWCNERGMEFNATANKYIEILNKYNKYKKNNLINGMVKMKSSFSDVALDEIFYLDFYSYEIFGKTKLGQILLYAKQSQDRQMINQIAEIARPTIKQLMDKYGVDGVGFIPPTVKRNLQLMKQLEVSLNLSVKKINIVKLKTPIIIPQKTLSKIEDRTINARQTIEIEDYGKYNNILLIDDAVGSGSTLNEVAKKIRQKNLCRGKIIGLSIVGSFKGFEVISEI
ncbi:MAG TPA: hypothetical protein VMQ58_00470 [Candidatus Saccharimonadales bacterium]|nr:hypothetical protein [Candidatus Saccharimonadales bacterium]